jgi:hypothetical protein
MDSGGRNLVFDVLTEARLIVSCQSGGVPTDREWDNWLTATANLMHQFGMCRLLVLSERGHPTGAQVERLRQTGKRLRASGHGYPPTSIISPSGALRIFVNALMCINPSIRCYSPEDRERAFDHLGLLRSERDRAVLAVDRLHRKLEDANQILLETQP